MAFGSLGSVIGYSVVAEDKTAVGLGSASDRFRKIGRIAGTAMTGIGAAALLAGDQVSSAYADIRIGTGATGEALKGLEEDFHAVYGAIPGEAAAVSGALAAMNTTTGASGDLLQDLTTNIMEVSRMLGEDGAGNAQIFGEAMKQWQIPAEDGITLMDQFFKITQATGIGFGELTGALNAYGPVLQNAGFTAAESAELFGRLEGSGIAVSRVMPGLNAAFRKWAEEGINGRVALEGTITAIMNAETEMEALTIATETFGAEGAQRMTTAVRNSTFELSSLGVMLEGTEGLIAETAEGTLTLSDKFGMFKARLTEALAPLEGVGAAMTVLGPIMIAATTIQWNKVTATLAHTKALGGMIAGLFTSGGALSAHAIGLKLSTAAQWLMNTSLYACPLVWIVGAIAAVVGILYVLEKKFGIVTTAVRLLSDGITAIIGFFGSVADAIRGVVVDTDALAEADERLIQANEDLRESEERVEEAEERTAESAEDLAEASAELAAAQLEVAESAREVDDLTEAYEELKGAMDAVADLTEDQDDLDRSLRGAKLDLADAQDKYNEMLSGSGKNSKSAQRAQEGYNKAVKDHGADSEEARKAQDKYNSAVSASIPTQREIERAALRVESAIDRVDDIKKRQIKTTEKLTEAEGAAVETKKKYGDKTLTEVKANLDANITAHKEQYDNIAVLEAKTEEIREQHAFDQEDVDREKLVYDQLVKLVENTSKEKEKILEGEVKASESALGKLSGFFTEHGEKVVTVLGSLLGPIAGVVYAFRHWDEIIAKVSETKDKIMEGVGKAIDYLGGVGSQMLVKGRDMIEGIIAGIVEKYHGIKSTIEEGINNAIDYLMGLPSEFFNYGVNLVQAIVEGILSMPGRVADAVTGIFNEINPFKPHSDAEKGPFSDLTESGRAVIKTFSKGIESEVGTFGKTFSADVTPSITPTTPIAPTSSSGGGDTYGGDTNSISIGQVTLSKEYDFLALMKNIETYQSQKRVQRGIRTL